MDSIYRIIGFDPGSGHFGVTVIEIDLSLDEPKPIIVHCQSHSIDSSIPSYTDRYPLASKRELRHFILYDLSLSLLNEFKPHAVVCESNYLGKFANAFSALVECVYTHRMSTRAYDSDIPLWLVEPSVAKKNIGAPPTGKDGVKNAVAQLLKDGWVVSNVDITDLDEHAIDSVAICCWGMVKLINGISWLFWREVDVRKLLPTMVLEEKLSRRKRKVRDSGAGVDSESSRNKPRRKRRRRISMGKISKRIRRNTNVKSKK